MLTDRETETLRLLSDGLTAQEIGATMGISARTVEAHIVNARDKLEARNACHLVALAQRKGLIAILLAAVMTALAPARQDMARPPNSARITRKREDSPI